MLVILPFCLLSCNKWLDVEPKSQVRDNDLFSTETGFKEALAGVYTSLTYEPLYGREMTFGLMGVLGYEWDYQSEQYDSDKFFEYTSVPSLARIDAVWNGMYTAIANNNKILEEIDGQKSVFQQDNYEVIKGESLALRAFLHFDLLRVFGASYEENPGKMAIPYFKKIGKEIAPQLTVSQVLDLAIADLNEAAELLKRDPLLTGRTVTSLDDQGYLMNRQLHLNYYAVKGLLARIYLYKKDMEKAYENAKIVIDANKFPWILQGNIATDLIYSTEHLFALNVTRLETIHENAFTATGGSRFSMLAATYNEYYTSSDYRYLRWFTITVDGSYYLNKYNQENILAASRNRMPVLKLAEMYFIAAEVLKTTNITQAANMINTVRERRGLTATTIDAGNIDAVIQQEFRREFIGEGQLFFYYKRKNIPRIPRAASYDIITLKGYKLPIPLSEYNNAPGRVNNR
ncbi:RagB/SusD family nutrient uptake outer membrane protein [Pedobacter frigoris]|uniref:RagB/SusD family nutrient uptake outer membrane protein n=2 Tax=Pedobacter frigoris TaxID=2571272 RepID=A0A4U1CS17_9SPHI|nr:RagB/SusD family nutrient uptake outer membrane protein [Pedobacter frigoris]